MKNQFLNMSMIVTVISAFGAAAHAQQSIPPLTLERAVTAYIERNLELQAERYRLERTRADAIAARLRPNPGLSVTAENLRVSGPTSFDRLNEFGVAYSETIELGGKRKLREQVPGWSEYKRAEPSTISGAAGRCARPASPVLSQLVPCDRSCSARKARW